MLLHTANPQRGSVAIIVAIMMTLLLGFGALAVDIGNVLVTRNELQNAADAAVLSGAGYLHKGAPIPNWTLAEQQTSQAISLNKSMKVSLSNGVVRSGYWNLGGSPSGLQSLPMTPAARDVPAVMVTISKASGQNGGEVPFYLAPILGINSGQVAATAVAVIASPGYVGPAGLFPIAIAECMYTNYWNSNATPPGPKNDPATGKPYVFKIGSDYHYPPCSSGEWTSFATDSNNVPTIRDLISNGNPGGLGIGDDIWIETGTKNTIFKSVDDCSAAGDKSCEYVTVPVVKNIDTHAQNPIVAFACIHIDLAVGGSQKYIQVEMSSKCQTSNSGGVGPAYGAYTPPRLAQ